MYVHNQFKKTRHGCTYDPANEYESSAALEKLSWQIFDGVRNTPLLNVSRIIVKNMLMVLAL